MSTVGTNHAWIEAMSSATGWSTGSHDTSFGFGALHVTATDTGVTPTKDYAADFTLRRYTHIRMWIDDVSKLATLTLRTYDSDLTQIGSQDILTGAQKVAVTGWNDLVVVRSSFPTNHRRIRFDVTATTSQTVNVYIGAIQTCDMRPLCTIWTDDGDDTVYDLAYPLLAARNMPAMVSVHSSTVGTAGTVTTAELQTLDGAGWDICNHSQQNEDLTALDETTFRSRVNTCMAFLRDTVGIKQARHLFVHPQGDANANTRAWLADYAWMDRSTSLDNSRIPTQWISLGGKDVTKDTTVATVKGWIDSAITDQEWLILIMHKFTTGTPATLEYNTDDFDEILAYLETNAGSIDVVTATEAVAVMAPNYALTGDDTVAVLDRATAYWKGVDYSGAGDWLDGSGNGHDATPRNSPSFSGGDWTLNGTNQDFSVSHHTDLDVGATDSFTLLVLCATSVGAFQAPISKRTNATTAAAGYLGYMEPDQMRVEVSDGSFEDGEFHTSDFDITPGDFNVTTAWAFTRDVSADEFKVARNGTYAAASNDGTTATLANTVDLYIGSLGGAAYFWNGTISAAAVFVGEALSEADLATAATELQTATPTGGAGTPSGIPGNEGIAMSIRFGM